MDFSSPTPSLTPSIGGSPPPWIPVQPDHFYRSDDTSTLPSSPRSFDGTPYYDPEDDRLASRGIPVFKPTMDEFRDFEAYMNRVECWGKYSGIVKVIPPKEWSEALPSVKERLPSVQIKAPIEQLMLGQAGLFRQQNMEKRKTLSVREWAEFCAQPEFRAPSIEEVGIHTRTNVKVKARKTRKSKLAANTDNIEEDPLDEPRSHSGTPAVVDENVKTKKKQATRLTKEEKEAERTEKDASFFETFDPAQDWLPFGTKPEDYTPEFCARLERHYWRNLGLGKAPWYGADTQGSLYSDETEEWNVAHLESELSRLLPSSDRGLPGVNTPYLYWGMWRATFAWHVEDMDLFSINYIHFGAPKFWYAVPQGRAAALEQTMRSYFPEDTSQCPQFLRHKSFLASPTLLAKSSCKPNTMVQHAGEFVITFPRGYHAGFNLGFNCAESVNFALKSWIEIGKVAKACKCVSDSVIIDVNQLLEDRAMEREMEIAEWGGSPSSTEVDHEEVYVLVPPLSKPRKRKATSAATTEPPAKKPRKSTKLPTIILPAGSSSSYAREETKPHPKLSIKLKLGPKPEVFPCCLCVSMSNEGLLTVNDPPFGRREALEACSNPAVWMAHEECANIIPETWVDEIENASGEKKKVVYGVDGVVKDRWNLKCSACTKSRSKSHGAPIQCTRGKCLKAFHVSCARDGKDSIVFDVLREVEKEVVLLDSNSASSAPTHMQVDGLSTNLPIPCSNSTTDTANQGQTSNVLKIIKKVEVEVLCYQHNPAVAAAKKASKQDKIKTDLLALPPMSRIKLRVSAGVFEVSLVRVIEENGSVEVLWDRGSKREFKWGSVVFGDTDGPVQQKPSEPAPDHPPPPAQPATSHVAALAAYSATSSAVSASYRPAAPQYAYSTYNAFDYRNYQTQPRTVVPYAPQPSTATSAGGSSTITPSYAYTTHYAPWQQLQQPSNVTSGPSASISPTIHNAPNAPTRTPEASCPNNATPLSHSASNSITPLLSPIGQMHTSMSSAHAHVHAPAMYAPSPPSQVKTPAHAQSLNSSGPVTYTALPVPATSTTTAPYTSHPDVPSQSQVQPKAIIMDFQYLQALPPAQLAQLIQGNSELRNLFQSAVASGK